MLFEACANALGNVRVIKIKVKITVFMPLRNRFIKSPSSFSFTLDGFSQVRLHYSINFVTIWTQVDNLDKNHCFLSESSPFGTFQKLISKFIAFLIKIRFLSFEVLPKPSLTKNGFFIFKMVTNTGYLKSASSAMPR